MFGLDNPYDLGSAFVRGDWADVPCSPPRSVYLQCLCRFDGKWTVDFAFTFDVDYETWSDADGDNALRDLRAALRGALPHLRNNQFAGRGATPGSTVWTARVSDLSTGEKDVVGNTVADGVAFPSLQAGTVKGTLVSPSSAGGSGSSSSSTALIIGIAAAGVVVLVVVVVAAVLGARRCRSQGRLRTTHVQTLGGHSNYETEAARSSATFPNPLYVYEGESDHTFGSSVPAAGGRSSSSSTNPFLAQPSANTYNPFEFSSGSISEA